MKFEKYNLRISVPFHFGCRRVSAEFALLLVEVFAFEINRDADKSKFDFNYKTNLHSDETVIIHTWRNMHNLHGIV